MAHEIVKAENVSEAKPLLGKKLVHVRRTEGDDGFVLCFGEDVSDMKGPMILMRLEDKGNRVELKMYFEGTWQDSEEVIGQSN